MKKVSLFFGFSLFMAGSLHAGKDPLAGYSSGTLLVAAAKNFGTEVQQGAHHLAAALQKRATEVQQKTVAVYASAYGSVVNQCEKHKTIIDTVKVASAVGWCVLTQRASK